MEAEAPVGAVLKAWTGELARMWQEVVRFLFYSEGRANKTR